MKLKYFGILALVGVVVFFLFESEDSCFDRINNELDIWYEIVAEASSQYADQKEILNQKARLLQLYSSASISVCEFYLDGFMLRNK